jgi:Putative Actinobacterial Holin-X, holin superfamily III
VTEHLIQPGEPYGSAGDSRNTLGDAGKPDVASASVGELVGEVSRDLSTLMRQELALAKAEMREEAVKSGKAVGLLGGAGLAGYFVLLFLSAALWAGLSNVMDPGWAALIVAGVWALVGGVLYTTGRDRIRQVRPKPERTVDTLKEIPSALKPGQGDNHDQ